MKKYKNRGIRKSKDIQVAANALEAAIGKIVLPIMLKAFLVPDCADSSYMINGERR